jgi:hypothetical protein
MSWQPGPGPAVPREVVRRVSLGLVDLDVGVDRDVEEGILGIVAVAAV